MTRWVKRTAVVVVVLLGLAALASGTYAYVKASAFDQSVEKVYDVPVPTIQRSSDATIIARGKHLAESIGACATTDCHGSALGGGRPLELGPLGVFAGPNITGAGLGATYTDGELFRLVRHGLGRDGRSLLFMPAHEIN